MEILPVGSSKNWIVLSELDDSVVCFYSFNVHGGDVLLDSSVGVSMSVVEGVFSAESGRAVA